MSRDHIQALIRETERIRSCLGSMPPSPRKAMVMQKIGSIRILADSPGITDAHVPWAQSATTVLAQCAPTTDEDLTLISDIIPSGLCGLYRSIEASRTGDYVID